MALGLSSFSSSARTVKRASLGTAQLGRVMKIFSVRWRAPHTFIGGKFKCCGRLMSQAFLTDLVVARSGAIPKVAARLQAAGTGVTFPAGIAERMNVEAAIKTCFETVIVAEIGT